MMLNGELCFLADLPILFEVEVHVGALLVLRSLVGRWVIPPEPSAVLRVVSPVSALHFLCREILLHRALLTVEDEKQRLDADLANDAQIDHAVVR